MRLNFWKQNPRIYTKTDQAAQAGCFFFVFEMSRLGRCPRFGWLAGWRGGVKCQGWAVVRRVGRQAGGLAGWLAAWLAGWRGVLNAKVGALSAGLAGRQAGLPGWLPDGGC
jgi:hypothetical protein